MKLFDCYCAFGEVAVKPPKYSRNAEELLEVMEFCGIDEALVFHSEMKYGSPVTGNKSVVEETRNHNRLHPTWAILPPQTGEQPETSEFIKAMKGNNVKALYAFPQEHAYIPDKVVFGELFEELIACNIPLLIKPDWPTVYSILSQFPRLTLIAVGHGPHGADRYFRPLIEKYPNFYIDTGTYLQDGGIEEFCNKYGAERMLFSTGYPGNCIGGPILRALKAGVKDSQRELICHRNIERILEGVKL